MLSVTGILGLGREGQKVLGRIEHQLRVWEWAELPLGAPPSGQALCFKGCQATCHAGLEAVVGASAVMMEKQRPRPSDGGPAQGEYLGKGSF